jgi:glycosyltransferase involved in cell wall biosynthesis
MEVHQLVSSFVPGDAISNFALFLKGILGEEGFRSEIFSENISPELLNHSRHISEYRTVDSQENILLAHYSIASMAMVALPLFKAKKVLLYHNITPYQYWVEIDSLTAFHCLRGRTDLTQILPYVHHGIAFSDFSLEDLRKRGLTRITVFPLRMDVDRLKLPPDSITLRLFDGKKRRILVAGRVAPNKKIEEAIRIASIIPDVWLIVAGSFSSAKPYYYALLEEAKRLNVKCDFTGHLPQKDLNALYKVADVLLVVSDHEGFCLPILEAFHFQLPVIAHAIGGIPETANGAALLFEEQHPEIVAGLISKIFRDPELRFRLQSKGTEVLRQYLEFPFRKNLLSILHEVASMPPIPCPTQHDYPMW